MNRIENMLKHFYYSDAHYVILDFYEFYFPEIIISTFENNLTTYEALKYYTHLKGYYGLDHISKGIAYIACVLIPLNFFRFNDIKR